MYIQENYHYSSSRILLLIDIILAKIIDRAIKKFTQHRVTL